MPWWDIGILFEAKIVSVFEDLNWTAILFFIFKMRSHDLELLILLWPPPKWVDYGVHYTSPIFCSAEFWNSEYGVCPLSSILSHGLLCKTSHSYETNSSFISHIRHPQRVPVFAWRWCLTKSAELWKLSIYGREWEDSRRLLGGSV